MPGPHVLDKLSRRVRRTWMLKAWSQGGDRQGEILSYPTLDEMASYLRELVAANPDLATLEEAGRSVEGRPLWLLTIADRRLPDDDKECVLMIGQEHGGFERSGTLALLELARWLTTPDAEEIRRRQVVALIPAVNPDAWDSVSFHNANGVNLYADYTLDGEPTQPESRAVAATLRRLRPEVLCAHHGTYYGWKYRMTEGAGLSYATSQFDRAHSRLLVEELHRAAEAAGFPQDRGEEDAQRILPWLPGHAYHSYGSGLGMTPCVYAYHHFHTLGISTEIHYPLSGLIRCIRLLELGNRPWRNEKVAGYPVRAILWQGHVFLVAYGQTAAERRASRAELWPASHQLVIAVGRHQPVGFSLVAFSVDPDDQIRWSGDEVGPFRSGGMEVGEFLDFFAREEGIDLSGVRAAYASQPRQKMAIEQTVAGDVPARPLLRAATRGLSLQLRLPGRANPRRVWLDGRVIGESPRDGYEHWATPNGFTMLQVNVPPRRESARPQRHLILVEYDAPRIDR